MKQYHNFLMYTRYLDRAEGLRRLLMKAECWRMRTKARIEQFTASVRGFWQDVDPIFLWMLTVTFTLFLWVQLTR